MEPRPPPAPPTTADRVARAGFWGGLLLFAALLAAPAPAGLAPEAWRVAALAALVATYWMTEALPLPVTAFLPLALLPILGARTPAEAASPYANPLIFLFLGGFVLALGLERWGVHRRLALAVVARVGTSPRRLVAGMLAATAFLSLWISNTATALMMLPLALSFVDLAPTATPGAEPAAGARSGFASALLLAVAYAANIGGMGTLVGTPTNAFLAGFLQETYGVRLSFLGWMGVALPLVVAGLGVTYVVLTRTFLRGATASAPGARAVVAAERARLGPLRPPEVRVTVVFALTALGWMFAPLVGRAVPGLTETGIAVLGAVALFVVPAGDGTRARLLEWATAERLPWGVLLLFGGGLSLAGAIEGTGLAAWIGTGLAGLGALPFWALLLVLCAVLVGLTELTSNTATAAAFLPVLAPLAVALGQNPLLLAVPATLAASAGFMLPAGTPPNAIAYATGHVRMADMLRVGLRLDVAFALLTALVAYALVGPVLGVAEGVVPAWARP